MSDRVLVNRLAYDFGSPQRGQIVVFTAPAGANVCQPGDAGTTFVKRLIGLPGETVREDGHGFILDPQAGGRARGRSSKEPYLSRHRAGSPTSGTSARPGRCRQGEYFMLGDNRPDSCDSRTWGRGSAEQT